MVVEPDGAGGERERVLVDPLVLDPAGTTTLDAWQPSKEGDLLAYQVSHGGTEESVLHVLDVATGALVDGPVDRARYSPVAWLPGGEAFCYVRRLPPEGLPDGEKQYHRRVWLHRVGTPAEQDVELFGAGLDMTNYYGVSRQPGRAVAAGLGVRGHRAAHRRVDRRPARARRDRLADVRRGRRRAGRRGRRVGRARRAAVRAHGPRRAARAARGDGPRRHRASASWTTLLPEDPEAVLEDVALVDDGGDATTPTHLLASWRRHAVSEVTVHDPATGARRAGDAGVVPLPGLGSVSGLVTRPDGGTSVWFSLHRPRDRPARAPLRRDHRRGRGCGRSRRARAGPAGRAHAAGRGHVAPTARPCGRSCSPAPTGSTPTAGRSPRRRRCSTGTAASRSRSTPAYSASTLAWVEAGGVYVVANLRGGGEEGEQWHRDGMRGAQAERLRRLPRGRRAPRRRRAGRRRRSWRAGAGPTAGCSSVRR